MCPLVTRLILITCLLVSLHTSATMLAGVVDNSQGKAQTSGHCADMPGMSSSADNSAKPSGMAGKTSCDISCCMSFVATSTTVLMLAGKTIADFQNLPAKSPSHFTRINYRPPILS